MLDGLSEILISYVTNAPIIAFLLWQMERQRKDYNDRIKRKDAILDRMLERERNITDKALDILTDEK